MQPCYTKTIHSCYLGYVIQAIVNNFVPLLLVTFQAQYHIRLEQATLLLSVNFIIQLLTDCFLLLQSAGRATGALSSLHMRLSSSASPT